jgi:UDP-3-O-[3-hydroxymyristoyl] glucosamine N-acyltransferase
LKPIIQNLSEIISFIDTSVKIINENPDLSILKFSPICGSSSGDMTFCSRIDTKSIQSINDSNASLILCPQNLDIQKINSISTLILVDNPRLWFMRCIEKFTSKTSSSITNENHFTTNSIIESDSIGSNTSIGNFCFIEKNVKIGNDCIIYPGVQIYNGTKIGNNVKIFPSVIIGASIFGPQRNKDMKLETCHHLAGVNIGNDVEIGSNTSILPGFLKDTKIDDGTKISSQVYIGSAMQIGKNCMITGKTYFGGSSTLEDNVYIGPGANIRNGITISKNSFVGIGSNVIKDVPENTTVIGNPAKSIDHNSDPNAINNIN